MVVDSRVAPLLALLAAVPAGLGIAPRMVDEPMAVTAPDGSASAAMFADTQWQMQSIQCPAAGDPGSGDHGFSIEVQGMTRQYDVHVPTGYDSAIAAPLLVRRHALASDRAAGPGLEAASGISDLEGFVVVYPRGFESSWNAGECCGAAAVAGIDDVGFVLEVLGDVSRRLCIDASRVYVAGEGNGGVLAWRIACEAPEAIAGFAVIDADTSGAPCVPSASVPVLNIGLGESSAFPYEALSTDPAGGLQATEFEWQAWSFLSAQSLH